MRTLTLLFLSVLMLIGNPLAAQAPKKKPVAAAKKVVKAKSDKNVPLRAQREVTRRGNMVEEIGGGISAAQIETDIALTVPEDDSWKWYISVISKDDCVICDNLKQDFISDPNLQAWVSVDDPEKSWAHYKVYRWEDKTTHSRFENIKITGFPTIILQPPRNQHFGSSSTVVFQKTGYGNKRGGFKNAAKSLSNEMSETIKKYVKAIQNNEDRRKSWGTIHEYEVEDGEMTPRDDLSLSITPPQSILLSDVVSNSAIETMDKPIEGGFGQPPFDFDGKPTVDPKYPTHPPRRDVPPEGEESATPEELRKAIPDADAAFILKHVEEGSTIEEAVKEWKRIHPFKPLVDAWKWYHILGMILGFLCPLMFFIVIVVAVVFLVTTLQKKKQPQVVNFPQQVATAPTAASSSVPH